MSAIYILWLREVRRFARSKIQILSALCQPALYLLTFALGLDDTFRKAGRGSYLQFVTPGVLSMTVLFAALFSGVSLIWDRQFGFLKETLVAPVPRICIMLGRTFGVATVAVVQGVMVAIVSLLAGFHPASPLLLLVALAFLTLIALVFASLGAIIGSSIKDMQEFQTVLNFLVLPVFFLSGALYPLDTLPAVLTGLTRLDPLSYGVDGLRLALTAQSHFTATLDATVLISLALATICLGAWRFSKIEI